MSEELIALRDIPSTVSIRKGDRFVELNPEQARHWVATGMAQRPQPVNARGWDGLDWPQATVVIIASGPSLDEEQCARVRDWRMGDEAGGCAPPIQSGLRRVIAINTTFRLAPWADVLYACDFRWWQHYIDEVRQKFAGVLWTQDSTAQQQLGVNLIRSERLPGLNKRPGMINQGANGGYQAVNLAYQAGASRIVLLGYDMKNGGKNGRKTHWHGDHPSQLNALPQFEQWIANFERMAVDLKTEGVDVVNATPRSALKCFPTMPIEEALQ